MAGDIGYRLRRAREARGLTVDEVADRLRIDKLYVTAMEQGRFDTLPSPFYARSYLRTYAHFLGLDVSAVLREYREQTAGQDTFNQPVSRGRRRGYSRSSHREEDGYHQWPLSERKVEREHSSLTRRSGARRWERGAPSHDPEPSERVPYRSTHSQGWADVSRGDTHHAESVSSDPDSHRKTFSSSHATSPSRSISMPKDVPSPSEIGLPASPDETGERTLPALVHESNDQEDAIPHLSRRRKKAASKEKEGTFGKWYNRFLITGTILLIPAALAVGILVWGDKNQSINAGDPAEVSADSNAENKNPIVYPIETNKNGPDHFELTQVDKIELKIEAEGECRIELREQEVGKKLKEVTLKSDSAPFAYEYDKEDLWIELEPSKSVKISVNGESIGKYKKQKVVHIRLVK